MEQRKEQETNPSKAEENKRENPIVKAKGNEQIMLVPPVPFPQRLQSQKLKN